MEEYTEQEPSFKVNLAYAATSWTKSTSSGCAASSASDPNYPLAYWTVPGRYEHGWKNKKWRDQVKRCRSATTEYDFSIQNVIRIPGQLEGEAYYPAAACKKYPHKKYLVEGDLYWWTFSDVFYDPSLVSNCQQAALSKFYKRAIEVQRQFSAGTFLGELRETLRSIRDPARTLRRLIGEYWTDRKKKIRRTTPRRLSEFQRMTGDSWLEAVFGWAPLINDLHDACKYLAERELRLKLTCVRIKGKSTGGSSTYTANANYMQMGAYEWTFDKLQSRDMLATYYGAISCVPSSNPVVPDAYSLGLRSWKDAVLIGWELLPYSWLVDYFSNIGDILESWAFQRSSLRWVAYATRKEMETTGVNLRWYLDPSFYSSGWRQYGTPTKWPGQVSHNVINVNRVPLDPLDLPVPDLNFEIPGFSTKWINLGALLASRNADRMWAEKARLPLEQRRIVARTRRR